MFTHARDRYANLVEITEMHPILHALQVVERLQAAEDSRDSDRLAALWLEEEAYDADSDPVNSQQ